MQKRLNFVTSLNYAVKLNVHGSFYILLEKSILATEIPFLQSLIGEISVDISMYSLHHAHFF